MRPPYFVIRVSRGFFRHPKKGICHQNGNRYFLKPKMRYNSTSVNERQSQGGDMAVSKRANTAILIACCIAFGLYWGTSYVGFSNALLDLRLTAFVEVLARGISCILFALVLNKMKRVPLPLFIAMLVLQVFAITVKTTGIVSQGVMLPLAASISYSLYSGFLIVCSAYCLYSFSSHKSIYCIVPIGFIISYAYGMLIVAADAQPAVNALTGIAVPLIIYFPMRQKGFLSRMTPSTHVGADNFIARSKAWFRQHSESSPSFFFLGAIALFLILIGVWFRIGANIEGSLWLLSPQIGSWCIFALAVFLAVMAVTDGKVSIRSFSIGTLAAFLGVLILTAFFWNEATDLIRSFSSIWLVTFQSMLYVSCRSFGKTNVDRAIGLGAYQGIALVMLAIGNVIGLFFFENLALDKFSFMAFSFVFMLIFVVATVAEFYPLLKRTERAEKAAANDSTGTVGSVSENQTDRALASLCEKYGVTAREQDIIGRYSRGRSIASIADDLFLSKDTVKTHVKRTYAKLDVHNKRELQDAIGTEEKRLSTANRK